MSKTSMNSLKIISKILSWLLIIPISLLAIYILSSNFRLLGTYQSFLVQSGSMEPAIMTGDVIVIKSLSRYQINDVVTFTNNSGKVVTHRIIEVNDNGGEKTFDTKGDANRSGDDDAISEAQVMGKVVLVIPKLGYIVAFSKTPLGIMFLLLIPAAIFALDELAKIKNVQSKN